MASNSNPISCKESFLQENQLFSEIELNDESKTIGNLHEFDLLENEIWLLQCPKGMNITELQNQRLKIPGRTNINNNEAVSMEFNEGDKKHAFAYCNRKGRYALRLLPVRGTIVVRDCLKATTTVTAERAEEYCPPAKRVPMPQSIRVRHPLLGAQYADKMRIDKSIAKRLQKADEQSAKILKESFIQRNTKKPSTSLGNASGKQKNIDNPIEVNSTDDDVEFVSEQKVKKKKKNKRKLNESSAEVHAGLDVSKTKQKKSKQSSISETDFVSKDLQWLQDI